MCQITITAVNLLKLFGTGALGLQFSLIFALHFLFSYSSSQIPYQDTESYRIESEQLRSNPSHEADPTQSSKYCGFQMVLEKTEKKMDTFLKLQISNYKKTKIHHRLLDTLLSNCDPQSISIPMVALVAYQIYIHQFPICCSQNIPKLSKCFPTTNTSSKISMRSKQNNFRKFPQYTI